MKASISDAVLALRGGGVVCHACEGVWGFACDSFNEEAVRRILTIKKRQPDKGLIVIADHPSKFAPEIEHLTDPIASKVHASWPGHTTWLLPNVQFPQWITGEHQTVAARVPDHAQALELAREWGKPLVSTSANVEGDPPCTTEKEAHNRFGKLVDVVLSGSIGEAQGSSQIIDAETGEIIR